MSISKKNGRLRVLLATSNARRHRAFIERLSRYDVDVLVVSESQPIDTGSVRVQSIGLGPSVAQHFKNIAFAEQKIFGPSKVINLNCSILPISLGEINHADCFEEIKRFTPNIAFVFGSSWIKQPLIGYLEKVDSYNIHMGVSPYYRGHSTNFWAFWRGEPQFVGATILKLNKELDAGAIVAHVRPQLIDADDYYMYSMRVADQAIQTCSDIITNAIEGLKPRQHVGVDPESISYFKSSEFTDNVAKEFLEGHEKMMRKYIESGVLLGNHLWQIPLVFE
ncbi:MAG: hypothetical protein K9H25_13680 [Rhodospirillum sp.]|nr:hypothetical protein [Rhodospirillum sp.]MCF8487812.1 hypothetical protein [Rhodospirillum sp.]MCF8499910.1 hypothetical protein [Rhodospirillum sp.]